MAKVKLKEQLIESITYQSSSQAISRRDIYALDDKKIKLDIKSDSYKGQCHARGYVLKQDKWMLVYTIPYSLMQTPDGIAYKSDYKNNPSLADKEFAGDVQKLKDYIEKILF